MTPGQIECWFPIISYDFGIYPERIYLLFKEYVVDNIMHGHHIHEVVHADYF